MSNHFTYNQTTWLIAMIFPTVNSKTPEQAIRAGNTYFHDEVNLLANPRVQTDGPYIHSSYTAHPFPEVITVNYY